MIWKKKKRRSLGQFTFRYDTFWHAPALLCHACGWETVTLWWGPHHSVSVCSYQEDDNSPSLPGIRRHILRNCQNTFEAVQKNPQKNKKQENKPKKNNQWQAGCRRWKSRRLPHWCTWHHSITMVVCCHYLPKLLKLNVELAKVGLFFPRRRWNWGQNYNLSVNAP